MALKDLLYIPFEKPYERIDVQQWLEYISLHMPSIIRLPQSDASRGTITTITGVTLDFVCCSPESGPIIGCALRPSRMMRKTLLKSEIIVLQKIKSHTKLYKQVKRSLLNTYYS